MPRPGFFILHDVAVPDLVAGDYVLRVNQRVEVPGEPQDPIPAKDTHFKITAPRFILAPDQILSTYPPNQAQGAFSSRLPQIVLRRRTLPWERRHAGQPDTVPWLALVVIADGEGELRPDVPVAQCVTPGVTLTGPRDAEKGTALRVTRTVVQRVFPGRDEVALLAHVREVDISDTELILGDDDGWMAVVVANRLPQPGVRYRACLISLEGQLNLLPDGAAAPAGEQFSTASVYPEINVRLRRGDLPGAIAFASARAGYTVTLLRRGRGGGRSPSDAWSESRVPQSRRIGIAGYAVEGRLASSQVGGVEMEALHPEEDILVFPVLAHWTFTCSEAGDFQSRMQELHVGLHGTLRAPAPPLAGKTAPPATRSAPSVLSTGHVALESVTREGDAEQIWYRGPLSPRPGTRTAADAAGVVPILHVADQARRIGPDGREDVSLAVAFEIGRLLGLAESAVVAALLRWRRGTFAIKRAAALLARDPRILTLLERDFLRLPIRLARDLLLDIGAEQARLIGPGRPAIDLGRPFVPLDDLGTTIAQGFGLPVDQPEMGPPEVGIITNPADILANGIGGLPHVLDALDGVRDELVRFADERERGVRP